MEEVLGAEKVKELLRACDFSIKDPIPMYEHQGVLFPLELCKPIVLQAMETWKARPEDVFVVTYPKAGTTWIQEVVSAILNKGDIEKLNKTHTFFRVPFIEATFFNGPGAPETYEIVDKMKYPRSIKSHLPGHLLPPDVFTKKAKIVYVARNPKDVCVSFYHFHIMNPQLPTPKSWNEFFEEYFTGQVTFGSWWEHYLYYWNRRHEPNVLFLKFEDMKRDLKAVVEQVANFLDYTLFDEVIDRIVDHCSFASMTKNPMTNPDSMFDIVHESIAKQRNEQTSRNDDVPEKPKQTQPGKQERLSFMRKGKVGDWRNIFTVAQNEAFDALMEEKLAGSGLTFEF